MKRRLLLVLFTSLTMNIFAQISDEQVVGLLQKASQQGMTQQEMLSMLSQHGVTREQLLRIKNNYEKNHRSQEVAVPTNNRQRSASANRKKKNSEPEELQSEPSGKKMLGNPLPPLGNEKSVFGRNVFNNELLTFEPDLNIATPENYVLGPGDEVIVDIWGDAEQSFRQQISPDGTITDKKIGPVHLNGLSVKEANNRLKNEFSRIYSTMRGEHPTTFIQLSLGNIRSIRVNIVGEVQVPGTYTLPSLASLFHALYCAGGVNDIGSLRKISVSRGGKKLTDIDIYDYLLQGRSNLDIRLKDGDVVLVNPYQNLVSVQGKVKRPLIYEMKNGESVRDLLEYAGGFTGDAYKTSVRVIRKSGKEHQVYNVDSGDYSRFALVDGDEVTIEAVIDRYENRVEVNGAVFRPGLYALGESVASVKQLIQKAEGVRGDAFLDRAILNREKPDRSPEMIAIDLRAILEDKAPDLTLRVNDVLYIPSIFELKENYTVNIEGEVSRPGTYKYAEGMVIEDLIVQAGGLREAASVVRIDVARRIKNPHSTGTGNILADNYTLTLKNGLVAGGKAGFLLMPFDEIFVRRSPGYQEQQNVRIEGEVLFGGDYILSHKGERLSDLVKKAGGLRPEAYVQGARLTRQLNQDEKSRIEALLKFSKQSNKDSIDMNRLDIGNSYYVGIQLSEALKNPGSEYDIILREGDVLRVPEYTGTVRISGAVMYPNTVVYKSGAGLKHYIEQGGGFADRAKKKKVFIVYMNGTVSKPRTFAKAKIAPGCEIIVPVKPFRKGVGLAEILGIATSTTSMAALVTSIVNSTK